MDKEARKSAVCPRCGREYSGYPALSRIDNKTEICPDCGVREALENAGFDVEAQNAILGVIRDTPEQE